MAVVHLYLHIPFCHEICPYCSFYKHKPGATSQREFVSALLQELDWNAEAHDLAGVETVYLGGGTPSLLSPTNLEVLFAGLDERLSLSSCAEVTLEANPSTFDAKKAGLIKSLGVTRVSLGVQSFDPEQLQVLGRDHSREGAIESFEVLQAASIPSLNLDLMFSTPKQTVESWQETLETAISLRPDHLSCYNLTFEEDTAYFQKFLEGEYTDEPERNESMFVLADRLLTGAGFTHYETSNYGRAGHHSLHNQGYWQGNPYLGIGPSAVSCIQRERRQNVSDTAAYMHRVGQVGHAIHEHESLDAEAWRLERLALELRTRAGVSLEYINQDDLSNLIENELVSIEGERLVTTARGACLVDSIVEYLC